MLRNLLNSHLFFNKNKKYSTLVFYIKCIFDFLYLDFQKTLEELENLNLKLKNFRIKNGNKKFRKCQSQRFIRRY